MMQDWEQVRLKFQQIWGYSDFRYPQGEIIASLLKGQDTLVVMPTGGGKSICFQLPALLQTGLTLVISPLVALMENQVGELKEKGLAADLLHSQLATFQRKQILLAIEQQRLRLLYLSPETLLSPTVWERLCLPNIKINGLILDEAHCLVQWGDTFRPAYQRLGAVRASLLKHKIEIDRIAIAAFTATANTTTQKLIKQGLQLQQPQAFILSPYRPNLHLKVKIVWTPKGRKQQLRQFIQSYPKQAGLVYARSRSESETLAQWLQSLNYATTAYHAGLSAEQRREIEHKWLTDKLQFVVCTSAFGMGINKPDVRFIIHFQAPLLLSEYVQEIGRGGRDGKPAHTLTLISEPTGLLYPEDKQRQQYFNEKLQKQYQRAQQIAKKIPPQGEVAEIAKQYKDGEIALSLLHSLGQLEWRSPFHYIKTPKRTIKPNNIQQQSQQQMQKYLLTCHCRWQFLLNAFGFEKEATGFKCGHCDNCQR